MDVPACLDRPFNLQYPHCNAIIYHLHGGFDHSSFTGVVSGGTETHSGYHVVYCPDAAHMHVFSG